MTIANNFETYKKEIELIEKQNPVEHELYSIIACIMRERDSSSNISLRDVSNTKNSKITHSYNLSSDGRFPDFVILTTNYNLKNPMNEDILGAIEAKLMSKTPLNWLSMIEDDKEQLKAHIKYFEKVIYTNGLEWQFYEKSSKTDEPEPTWDIVLGREEREGFLWCANEAWHSLLSKLDTIVWK